MNKKFLILSMLILFTSAVYTQQMDENGVYLQAEKMPVIKGGMREIGRKIQYPSIAKEMGIQGVVYVGFVVSENGQVVDAKDMRKKARQKYYCVKYHLCNILMGRISPLLQKVDHIHLY